MWLCDSNHHCFPFLYQNNDKNIYQYPFLLEWSIQDLFYGIIYCQKKTKRKHDAESGNKSIIYIVMFFAWFNAKNEPCINALNMFHDMFWMQLLFFFLFIFLLSTASSDNVCDGVWINCVSHWYIFETGKCLFNVLSTFIKCYVFQYVQHFI